MVWSSLTFTAKSFNSSINNSRMSSDLSLVRDFLAFLTDSPTPFHAVANLVRMLRERGKFEALSEKALHPGGLRPNGRYYVVRNGSSLVAFVHPPPSVAINSKSSERVRCTIVATHSDSPCLKLKVNQSALTSRDGFQLAPAEPYGGGLWHTWFDRDLGIAGRVLYSSSSPISSSFLSASSPYSSPSNSSAITEKLVNISRPVCRIPSLAIHLDRSVNEAFKFNSEQQLQAIFGLVSSTSHSDDANAKDDGDHQKDKEQKGNKEMQGRSLLNDLLQAELLGKDAADGGNVRVLAHDLCLYDCTPACVGGLHGEFILGGRLDNLFMTFCAIRGLLDYCQAEDPASHLELQQQERILRMVAVFDHEEVGSELMDGADGNFLPSVLGKISSSDMAVDYAQSLLVSADMAHAVHPNYSDKHDQWHRPVVNGGIVLKHHSGGRYATQSRAHAALRHFCNQRNIAVQDFMVRNDSPCGSTVGPMLSSALGVPCVDLGLAQLAMHSVRELAGTADLHTGTLLFSLLFTHSPSLLDSLILD
jgi:aspartyl aminopeptidase